MKIFSRMQNFFSVGFHDNCLNYQWSMPHYSSFRRIRSVLWLHKQSLQSLIIFFDFYWKKINKKTKRSTSVDSHLSYYFLLFDESLHEFTILEKWPKLKSLQRSQEYNSKCVEQRQFYETNLHTFKWHQEFHRHQSSRLSTITFSFPDVFIDDSWIKWQEAVSFKSKFLQIIKNKSAALSINR